MASTTTLRNDPARTGTTPDFRINGNPWRKYVSMKLGCSIRAGVLVIENWQFSTGQHAGRTSTLVLATTTDNNVYCFSEADLLTQGQTATPLWHTALGVHPRMEDGWPDNGFSNIEPPIGVCGTPVVDPANRRMFVLALSATGDNHVGNGHYSVFELDLDTGAIGHSQELVDSGAAGRVTFAPADLDQRSALNLVNGWLWATFADIYNFDKGRYYGWIVAINADNLSQQLFQPMISLAASNNFGIYGGGVWGVGGVAAAEDGTVFALTGNATQLDPKDDKAQHPKDRLEGFPDLPYELLGFAARRQRPRQPRRLFQRISAPRGQARQHHSPAAGARRVPGLRPHPKGERRRRRLRGFEPGRAAADQRPPACGVRA